MQPESLLVNNPIEVKNPFTSETVSAFSPTMDATSGLLTPRGSSPQAAAYARRTCNCFKLAMHRSGEPWHFVAAVLAYACHFPLLTVDALDRIMGVDKKEIGTGGADTHAVPKRDSDARGRIQCARSITR